ncbi:MAG: DUF3048 domain-containing protein [Clostridia bacterium]
MGKHTEHEPREGKKGIKILLGLVLIAIIGVGTFLGWKYMSSNKTIEVSTPNTTNTTPEEIPPEPEKIVQIYQGDERPIACMIDNHSDAWPQFSINKAYAVYEIIVEGGETRLMAVFKGVEADQVGPMRSSRHYFLDYALENDAIYAHIGWSPQAQKDISTLGVNNINGLEYDTGRAWKEGDVFWRLSSRYAPHNSICNLATIKTAADSKGYRVTSTQESVLNYVTDEVTLEDKADAIAATNITIPFSTLQSVNFKYDETTQRYTRYARTKLQTDATDDSSITTKNIIITKAENYTLSDGENKGRQGLKNIGTSEGYYITNGKAIPITATKSSRSSQTVYTDSEGNEINVNDGNTFFEICPLTATITIE